MSSLAQQSNFGASAQLERELAYYRRECNDLGARVLRLQEEQSQAFREARRSRTVAKLIREANRLADTGITADELGGPMLEIIVDNAMCDRAAFLIETPLGTGRFAVMHVVGLGEPVQPSTSIPNPPPFFFTTAQTRLDPPSRELTGVLHLPFILWAYDRATGHALIIGNRSEANVSRAFQPGDQELIEGGLSVYLDVLARKHAEMQLRLAMRAAEEANEAKAAFLATLSHELRTPLDCIIGYSELMSLRKAPSLSLDKCGEYAQQIHGAGRHLLRLINDILDYSRIARGHLPLQLEWIRLAQAVQSAIHAASPLAEKHGISLEMEPIDIGTGVLVDTLRFRQVLDNLLSNAIKFTGPQGRVAIEVERRSDVSLDIVVRDTGVGIRPEDIPRALEPFRQIENAFTRSSPGTGLGLPIAKGLVEAHGGQLTIESEHGRGTAVIVTLPPDKVATGNAVRAALV